MSWIATAAPMTSPAASRIGAALFKTNARVPSNRAISSNCPMTGRFCCRAWADAHSVGWTGCPVSAHHA